MWVVVVRAHSWSRQWSHLQAHVRYAPTQRTLLHDALGRELAGP